MGGSQAWLIFERDTNSEMALGAWWGGLCGGPGGVGVVLGMAANRAAILSHYEGVKNDLSPLPNSLHLVEYCDESPACTWKTSKRAFCIFAPTNHIREIEPALQMLSFLPPLCNLNNNWTNCDFYCNRNNSEQCDKIVWPDGWAGRIWSTSISFLPLQVLPFVAMVYPWSGQAHW